MSDARVQFTPDELGKEVSFSFACPMADRRCGNLLILGRTHAKRDPQGKNGGVPQWAWDGNRDAPTFAPSINCKGCWHGYVRNGCCVDTNGVDEP